MEIGIYAYIDFNTCDELAIEIEKVNLRNSGLYHV